MEPRTKTFLRSERGFTLAGVIVIMTIMMIVVTYTVPRAWSTVVRRCAHLATAILRRLAEQENSDILAQMLAELEQLPENSAQNLLARTKRINEGESK